MHPGRLVWIAFGFRSRYVLEYQRPLAGDAHARRRPRRSHARWIGQPTGQQLARDVYKGNCLACHQIPGDSTAVSRANIGPPLVDMRSRFPDRATLRGQIWDSTARNPQTVMPPFGKHKVLTEDEIDLVVDYIYQY